MLRSTRRVDGAAQQKDGDRMYDRFRVAVIAAIMLTGLSGAAVADLAEPSPPPRPQVKVVRPVPVVRAAPRPRTVRRARPIVTVAAAAPVAKPAATSCSGFSCGRYLMVGIGF